VHVIPVEQIDYVEAQDDYVSIRAAGRNYLKEQTLGELEAQLAAKGFLRIHRRYILMYRDWQRLNYRKRTAA